MKTLRIWFADPDVRAGVRDSFYFLPVSLPIALPYALAGRAAGLADWQIVLWSAALYAGSAQLACLAAFAAGGGLLEILLVTFLANSRHAFLGMALAPYLPRFHPRTLPWLAFTLATPTIGLLPAMAKRSRDLGLYTLVMQYGQWAQWVLFTALGLWLGPMLPKSWAPVIAFAVPAGFLAMLVPLVREQLPGALIAALVAAVGSLALTFLLPAQTSAIVAAVAGAIAALAVPDRRR